MRQWLPLVWLLAVVGVSGCAKHWTKPGATNAEFSRDSYECALQHSDGGEVRKNLTARACRITATIVSSAANSSVSATNELPPLCH
jgi:hypothetical protein